MMEAIDRWWEEKDLGREEQGSELTQSLLGQASPVAEMEKLRQQSRGIWRYGFISKLTIYRLCDPLTPTPQGSYLTSLNMTVPSC